MNYLELYEKTREQLIKAINTPICQEAIDILNSKKTFETSDPIRSAFVAYQVFRAGVSGSDKELIGVQNKYFKEEKLKSEAEARQRLNEFVNLTFNESAHTQGRPIPQDEYDKYIKSANVVNSWAKGFAKEFGLRITAEHEEDSSHKPRW